MKTFEEAMKLRRAKDRKELAIKCDELERYGSIIQEIGESPTTKTFVLALVEMAHSFPEELSEEDTFLSLIMSAFINGVMVGIEMEKPE